MRNVEFDFPVTELTGRVQKQNKDGVIFRHKFFRDSNGNIIGEARKEQYIPMHPRNYKTKPMSESERQTVTAFQQAVAQYNIEKNDPERMAYWKARFDAQLRKPDPEAPIDPKTGRRRIYHRLDMFIRTMLQLSFRNQ